MIIHLDLADISDAVISIDEANLGLLTSTLRMLDKNTVWVKRDWKEGLSVKKSPVDIRFGDTYVVEGNEWADPPQQDLVIATSGGHLADGFQEATTVALVSLNQYKEKVRKAFDNKSTEIVELKKKVQSLQEHVAHLSAVQVSSEQEEKITVGEE